jgi:septum formation protein
MKKIILASTSPQRIMLLKKAGIKFEVIQSNYIEDITIHKDPHKLTQYLSYEKAKTVAKNLRNSIIIAADTIVSFNHQLIGKPKDKKDAKRILTMFNGKMHLIITGFTIIDTDTNKSITKSIKTKVYFKKLTETEIDDYVATGEPLNKAGAYGIQGLGKMLVKKVEGDFDNVVGLPVKYLLDELNKF